MAVENAHVFTNKRNLKYVAVYCVYCVVLLGHLLVNVHVILEELGHTEPTELLGRDYLDITG